MPFWQHPTMGLDPGLLRTKFRFCDTFLPDHLANGAHGECVEDGWQCLANLHKHTHHPISVAAGYILTVAQTGMHMVT